MVNIYIYIVAYKIPSYRHKMIDLIYPHPMMFSLIRGAPLPPLPSPSICPTSICRRRSCRKCEHPKIEKSHPTQKVKNYVSIIFEGCYIFINIHMILLYIYIYIPVCKYVCTYVYIYIDSGDTYTCMMTYPSS